MCECGAHTPFFSPTPTHSPVQVHAVLLSTFINYTNVFYSLHTRLHTHLPATSCHTISLCSQHTHFSIKEHTHTLPVLKRTGRQTVFPCTHSHLCKHTLRVNTPVRVLIHPPLTHSHSVIQIISLLPDLHAHFIPVRHTLSPSTHTHTHTSRQEVS